MAGVIGNTNGLGNSGGKSLNDRKLAASVRTLTLKKIQKILEGEENDYQRQIVLKLAGTVLPRLNEHTAEDGAQLFPKPLLGGQSNVLPTDNSNEETPSPDAQN